MIWASVLVLAVLTAVLFAAEGALLALTMADRVALEEDSSRSARVLRSLLESPRQLLFTLQVASEVGLVGVSLAVAVSIIEQYGLQYGWWTLVVAPPLLLIVCLLVPRGLASRHARWIALKLTYPLRTGSYVLFPLMWPIKKATEFFMRLLGIPSHGVHRLEESEFKSLVDIGEKGGTLGEQERELIHNVFEFGDIVASEVMTPRTEVIGFSINTPIEKILEELKVHRLSRVPIYKTNLDNVLGILYTKDLLALRTRGEVGKRTLKELLHPVYFVPVTKKIDELFREFQNQKTHLAAVVDEYGGVAGIVTMDDLLEELFGVMLDAHDVEESEFSQLDEHVYRIQAHMPLDEFEALIEREVPPLGEQVNTVGGYVLTLAGTLPKEGEVITTGDLEFTVEKVEGARLQEIRVTRAELQKQPEQEGV